MKILFINPNFRNLITPIERCFTTPFSLPLGIAYIASYLEKHGYTVKAVDAHAENLNVSQIIRQVQSYGPQIVGFSAHSSASHCASLAKEIKRLDPGCITVIGGVVASLLPKETLENYPGIDFLIYGEGEIAFLRLVQSLESRDGIDDIPSLGYRKNAEVIINSRQEMIRNLDTLPFPARHLFRNKLYRYWPRLFANTETLIAASRGCSAGNCDFCCIGKMFGTQVRKRSPENVVGEIELCVNKYNIYNFSFIDSTFTHDKEFVYRITDVLEKRKLHKKIKWWCSTRVDCVDEGLLRKMKSAGCAAVSFGVEFGSQKMLNFFNKGIDLKDTEKAFSLAKKVGIWTTAYMMVNQYSPSGPRSALKETRDFLLKIKPDLLRISPLIVTPGTKLFYCLQKQGGFKNADYYPCMEGEYIESKYIKRKSLNSTKRKIYFSYYLKPSFMAAKIMGLLS
jgi:anaerobic magnesium-protoporphyrin IX monomethyl ester cyclase